MDPRTEDINQIDARSSLHEHFTAKAVADTRAAGDGMLDDKVANDGILVG